jgi:hypothetical protein
MQYFIENGFGTEYNNMYKQQITDLWKDEYMPTQINLNLPDESNILANHIYKKRKSSTSDELDNYLNSPTVDFNTNVLNYWKVITKF